MCSGAAEFAVGRSRKTRCDQRNRESTPSHADFDSVNPRPDFSDFPGLRVRFGRWYVVPFPTCGCDACDETAESETERLRSLVDNMTAGRFREAIRVRADGTAWKESEFWSTGGRCPEELRLDQTRMRTLVDEGDRSSYEWGPWPRRN